MKKCQGHILLQVRLFGITSWGLDCAEGVGIYARVGFYENWINKMMDDDIKEPPPPPPPTTTPIVEYETTTKYIEYTTYYEYGEKVNKFF